MRTVAAGGVRGEAAEPLAKVSGMRKEPALWQGHEETERAARGAGEWAPRWGRGGTCFGCGRRGGGQDHRGGWARGLPRLSSLRSPARGRGLQVLPPVFKSNSSAGAWRAG